MAPGIYGEFIVDGVVVSAGTPLDLGSLAWTPPDFGSDLWQIGTFDRSAEEYLHGANDDYRRWGLWFDYPAEFPSDVHFVIGTSDVAMDWNYAHFERTSTMPSPICTASATSPEWKVEFSGAGVPPNRLATLTVAVAGQRGADLEVRLNGDFVGTWALPHDGSIIHRSGIRGAYQSHQFPFDTALVQAGANTLTLRHTSAGSSCTEGILYDALRLEIGGGALFHFGSHPRSRFGGVRAPTHHEPRHRGLTPSAFASNCGKRASERELRAFPARFRSRRCRADRRQA